jgi:hypothetical protein
VNERVGPRDARTWIEGRETCERTISRTLAFFTSLSIRVAGSENTLLTALRAAMDRGTSQSQAIGRPKMRLAIAMFLDPFRRP